MDNKEQKTKEQYPELQWLDRVAHWMDNSIPIPFLNYRIGLDAVVGLIPGVGDATTLAVSGLMILAITRHGVSFWVLLKMVWNIILDALVGSIPVLGDFFDMTFKANRKNMVLLKTHYDEDGYRMNGWLAGLLFLLMVIAIFAGITFFLSKGIYNLIQMAFSQ
jgi:hypothetical protein